MSEQKPIPSADKQLANKTDDSLMAKYQSMLLSVQMETYQLMKWTVPVEFMFEIKEAKMYQSKKYNNIQLMLKGIRISEAEDNEGNKYVETVRTVIFCPQSFQTQMEKQYGEMSADVLKGLTGQIIHIKFSGESEFEGQKFKSFFVQFMNAPAKLEQLKLPVELEKAKSELIKTQSELKDVVVVPSDKSEKDEAFSHSDKKDVIPPFKKPKNNK